jgi:hypothetical protein
LSVLEPDGSKVSPKLRTPLSILCEPLKVCLRRLCALAELELLLLLLLPHAASATALSTAAVSATARCNVLVLVRRCMQLPPQL